MAYEDLYYEIHDLMTKLNLMKKFEKELSLLRDEPVWRYREVRDRWEEAKTRTLKKHNKNENI